VSTLVHANIIAEMNRGGGGGGDLLHSTQRSEVNQGDPRKITLVPFRNQNGDTIP
jgi:hypothetical protein